MDVISDCIERLRAGEPEARDALFAAAYDELRRLARARLRDGGRSTLLDTQALVHETFMRAARGGQLRAADRRAFFAYASTVMRAVIIDHVRERLALRRGNGAVHCTLSPTLAEQLAPDARAEADVLRVHEALEALAASQPRLAQVVQMRYFGGFSEAEIADTLGVTERTVRRDWDKASALLKALLA